MHVPQRREDTNLRFLTRVDDSVTGTTATVTRSLETIWFAGLPVAQIDYNDLGTLRYTFTDHLGTPTLQTSSTGSIIWQMDREPYGKLYRVRTGKESAQPIRLPGQEMAADGNESYNIFRWYRSGWGRYTQADPIGTAGGLNLYGYVHGAVPNAADPFGLYRIQQQVTWNFYGDVNDWIQGCASIGVGNAGGACSQVGAQLECVGACQNYGGCWKIAGVKAKRSRANQLARRHAGRRTDKL